MAEESPLDGAGKRKRQKKPNPEGRIQFGLTVEFPDSPEARQRKDNIQRRLDDARRSLGIRLVWLFAINRTTIPRIYNCSELVCAIVDLGIVGLSVMCAYYWHNLFIYLCKN